MQGALQVEETILPTMNATRDGFKLLERQLISNLVQENVTKPVQEINFKAQVIIDIVVCNLFERTADVGFLAMDDAIREFILDGQRSCSSLQWLFDRLKLICENSRHPVDKGVDLACQMPITRVQNHKGQVFGLSYQRGQSAINASAAALSSGLAK
jgi:hypothetical protein